MLGSWTWSWLACNTDNDSQSTMDTTSTTGVCTLGVGQHLLIFIQCSHACGGLPIHVVPMEHVL